MRAKLPSLKSQDDGGLTLGFIDRVGEEAQMALHNLTLTTSRATNAHFGRKVLRFNQLLRVLSFLIQITKVIGSRNDG